MLRASVLMLQHIGYKRQAGLLEKALDICMLTEKKLVVTGRPDGATCDAFGDYVMDTLKSL
jgi:isocitrate dehydrogenase (NAD+)